MGVVGTVKNAASSITSTVSAGKQKIDDVQTLFTAGSDAAKEAEGSGWGTSDSKVRSVEDILEANKKAAKKASAERKQALKNLMGGGSDSNNNSNNDSNNDNKDTGKDDKSKPAGNKLFTGMNIASAAMAVGTGIMHGESIGQAIRDGVNNLGANLQGVAGLAFKGGSAIYDAGKESKKENTTIPSAAELQAQQKAIETYHANGRDTKYLTLTEKQWNGLSELQKYNVASTIFVDQKMQGVADFKTYAEKMTFGDMTNMMKAAVADGQHKELQDLRFVEDNSVSLQLSDEQMDTIDKNVEGENVFEVSKEGEVKAVEDQFDSKTVETEITSEQISDNQSAAAKQAEQSALIRQGDVPQIESTTTEELFADLAVGS